MIELRPMQPHELRTIVRQWRESYKPRGHQISTALAVDRWIRVGLYSDLALSPKLWHALHRQLVEALAGPDGVSVTAVACFPAAPDVVVGWICYEPGAAEGAVVHYVYVNEADRRHGIGSLLLATVTDRFERVRFSHMTRAGGLLVNAVAHRRSRQEIAAP